MKNLRLITCFLVAAPLFSAATNAQDEKGTQHESHAHTANATQAPDSHGSQGLHQAMMQGMQDMHSVKMTGNTDQDFASMMIHHHEQAIAMSKVQLKDGKDAQVRKKAQEIIDASEKDIADLKKWQKQNGTAQKTAAE